MGLLSHKARQAPPKSTAVYGVATRAFGSESDVDQNGRVMILFTPIVNGMTETAQCSQSYVTGFFFPLDIDPTAGSDNRSNQAEVFYAMVPDPQGTVTCDHSVERVTRIVPVTFIHEFQHMISFHQHVVLRAGSSEKTWLNEAMSHMAEELGALHFESIGQTDRFSAFSLGDLAERWFCVIAYLPKATVQAAMGAVPLSMVLEGRMTSMTIESGQTILALAVLSIIITAPLGAIGIKLAGPRLLERHDTPHQEV